LPRLVSRCKSTGMATVISKCLYESERHAEHQLQLGNRPPTYCQEVIIEGEGSQAINFYTILKTEANEVQRPAHDSMPVILHPDYYELYVARRGRAKAQSRERVVEVSDGQTPCNRALTGSCGRTHP
jgi:putative SOS response-associated peptidase YedK